MKTLLLGRHAKSDHPSGVPDLERPLATRGEQDLVLLGRALQNFEWSPEVVFSSPAVRAYKTAEGILFQSNSNTPIQISNELYEHGVSGWEQVVGNIPDKYSKAALWGHNPDITKTIAWALGLASPPEVPTGTICLIHSQSPTWKHFFQSYPHLLFFCMPRLLEKRMDAE